MDIPEIKRVGTALILDYFNDADYSKDRKASIASHLLGTLPDVDTDLEIEPTEAEASDNDLLEIGDEPDINEE